MKSTLLGGIILLVASLSAGAQSITITASEMPVNGDKLLYSTALPTASVNLGNTGANVAWDFSNLTAVTQAIDTYKTAAQTLYSGGGISTSAYGYKIADSLNFPGAPVSAKNIYTFYNVKNGPSRFVAEGFGATISGFPVPAGYSQEDTIFRFPMTFGSGDTTAFKLTASLAPLGSWKQEGIRMWSVDGWGTIKTPYFTMPTAAIRVRSEVDEIDSVTFAATTFPVPRHYVEYKWLVNGEHYPALFVTASIIGTTETPTAVRYRDMARSLNIGSAAPAYSVLQVYPNPASDQLNVQVPAAWKQYSIRVYDVTGKVLINLANTAKLSTASLPAGKYLLIAENGSKTGLASFVK